MTARGLLVGCLLLIAGAPLGAQRPQWLGFRGDLGTEIPRGVPDRVFQGNIRGEFSVLVRLDAIHPVHFGMGFSWVSYPIEPGFDEEDQWNHVGLQLLAGLSLKDWIRLPLYVEARAIERRLRPINRRYWSHNSVDPIKQRPYLQFQGWSAEGMVGLELPMTTSVFLDVSARASGFAPSADLTREGLIPIDGGWSLGGQLGLIWFP